MLVPQPVAQELRGAGQVCGGENCPREGLAADHGQADHHTLLQNQEEAGVVLEAGRTRVRGDEQEHYGW